MTSDYDTLFSFVSASHDLDFPSKMALSLDDIQRIEYDAPRAHFLGLGLQRCKHAAEIEIARLDQVGLGLGVHENQLFSLLQLRQLPAEALGIGHDALRSLLESDEDAGLAAGLRAMHQELLEVLC